MLRTSPQLCSCWFLKLTGSLFICKSLTLLDIIIPPGGGPPPHIHHNLGEWLYFIDDGFTLFISDETYAQGEIPGVNAPKANFNAVNAKPGTLFYTPPNHIHAHTNTGTIPARELVVAQSSGGLDEWFQLGGVPITDPSNLPALDLDKFFAALSVASDFGLTLSSEFDDFIDTVDSNFPDEFIQNNRAEELIALLSNNTKSIPETSSGVGILAFGTLALGSLLFSQRKQQTDKVKTW
ncbi:cupin domain-containing protein [Moorena sp. SIO4A5]|uniref:cupin domain-containing protein n=1 Tax=Moorena sp. SIO4A5 TaxID=2607838 RepID=UPI0013C96B1D|nr:cupin domain-containing protein [Moorena sp. SIO4A5]